LTERLWGGCRSHPSNGRGVAFKKKTKKKPKKKTTNTKKKQGGFHFKTISNAGPTTGPGILLTSTNGRRAKKSGWRFGNEKESKESTWKKKKGISSKGWNFSARGGF